ncbi:MAG: pilus assembly protein PilM [Phycisphaerae bacterium]|jgi:Tfp pilus assembly protein PilN
MKDKKVFGIDICTNSVSFVQLEKTGGKIKFLKCATVPLAQGIVRDGVVQDTSGLLGVIKSFNITGVLGHINSALTICAEPTLLQIFNLPDCSPGEVKKIVQDEVRQYAVLPLKNIEMDYCGLKSADSQAKRVLVGAAQSEHLNVTVRAFEKHHINVETIEPAVTAFMRACFDKVIRPMSGKNIMLLLIRDENLTLCIFKKQRLEFLRTKKFESDIISSAQRGIWLGRDMESVIQFYELEEGADAQPWRIIVSAFPDAKNNSQIADELKKTTSRQNVEISAFDNSMMDIEIGQNGQAAISPVAAGAAMKLLNGNSAGISLDLMPREIVSIKKARKEMLIIVNAAACLLLLLFAYIAFIGRQSTAVGREVYTQKQKQIETNMQQMIENRKDIDSRLGVMKNNLSIVNKAVEARSYHNWARLLSELARNVPQTILIQNLQGKGENVIEIEGLATNYDAVNSFMSNLSQNKMISEATLADAGQDAKYGSKFVGYKIVCSLAK